MKLKNILGILLFILTFSCTIKSNIYIVTAINETSNNCIYTVTGSSMSMFIWNEPEIYVFEDDCDKYEINSNISCQVLNENYNLNSCR